ncbi:MAG TPA: FAD-dependent oxidoreductase, partial [Rhabdochlamydiaceae bacterium]|nr:FAD-dependent oxidoreductase [Rhabdochlamydiaceae bacterium]
MEELYADYVVIGSGPAGQKAAIQAAKLDKTVIVIEKDPYLGGASLNWGTIPSKSLREAILDLTGFYERSFYGQEAVRKNISINELNFRLKKTIEEQRKMIARQFEKNDIKWIHGCARFEDDHHIVVLDHDDKILARIKGDYFLISAGSKPRNPLGVPFDNEVILDSTRLLAIDHLPKTLLVLGGGIIGSEYASFFAALGTEVTVVDKRDHMLPLLDSEIGTHLQKSLTEIGLKMVGQKELRLIERVKDHAKVTFTDGTTLEAEMLLYALGREANVE